MQKKEYTRDGITVVWQPDLCIHSGVCFHTLPAVFKPRERPWVQLEGSDQATIESTVKACPSGALSLKTSVAAAEPVTLELPPSSKVNILPNGPVRVTGPCLVTLADGTQVVKPNGVSFCRCGGSANKPFCDGSHKGNGFAG